MSERIVIIIQCAGSKNSKCGFFRKDEKKVIFVADPDSSPEEGDVIFAHPDQKISEKENLTYREALVQYNENQDKLELLYKEGALPVIYCHIISLQNLSFLATLFNIRLKEEKALEEIKQEVFKDDVIHFGFDEWSFQTQHYLTLA